MKAWVVSPAREVNTRSFHALEAVGDGCKMGPFLFCFVVTFNFNGKKWNEEEARIKRNKRNKRHERSPEFNHFPQRSFLVGGSWIRSLSLQLIQTRQFYLMKERGTPSWSTLQPLCLYELSAFSCGSFSFIYFFGLIINERMKCMN